MSSRRLSPARVFSALVTMALTVFVLASAPALAIGSEMEPLGPATIETGAAPDGPCAEMDTGGGHSHATHGAKCLAACLASHGAVLPDTPLPDALVQSSPIIVDANPVTKLADHSFGLDPPPPRSA